MNDVSGEKLDITAELVTPENIVFRHYLAGPAQRIPAFLIDCACMYALFMVTVVCLSILSVYLPLLDEIIGGLMLVMMFLIAWFYGGILETIWNGRTVGKRVLGLRVVTIEGLPITPFQALMRNLLRFADLQPLGTGCVGLICMALNSRFQRLGDLACKTMVVLDRVPLLRVIPLQGELQIEQLAEQIPPNVELPPVVARALLMYAHRRPWFSLERRNEIAAPLAEIFRRRFGLPPEVSADWIVCAVYQKLIVGAAVNNQAKTAADALPVPQRAIPSPRVAVPVS